MSKKDNQLIIVIDEEIENYSQQIVEEMTQDLVQVISQYMEVNASEVKIAFESRDNQSIMVASIPVLTVQRS
ncbi:cell division topological specificity factor MinE [Heliorestis convoluta]|uniref:Putative septum formation topological specificity factor MinE family protein n=1 Tax=Heliorestis convoluta TaxID=356322 RepID=A0A5Q2N2H4_9FIRM|nr:cell division topological specificity factor MinE [Heliorestis convoluta]QGG46765.1 putative septum formation topological specificity factor MinE family protein [Heliorestis convoluta]